METARLLSSVRILTFIKLSPLLFRRVMGRASSLRSRT